MVISLRRSLLVFCVCVLTPASPVSAAVVAETTAPKNEGSAAVNVLRTFSSGGASTSNLRTALDGNEVLTFTYPNRDTSNFFNGYVWHLPTSSYVDALGATGGLQNGWVVRQSVWLAMDASDPLLNEGTWTESLKFEFASTVNGQGGNELFDTGALIPVQFTPNGCDILAETCSNPGAGFQISTTQWTQISVQYQIDDLDFTGDLETVIETRPVLFLGDFTAGEEKQGTLYVDNVVVEVFPDLATANSTPLPSNQPAGIPMLNPPNNGDYNSDGVIDAADYTVYRDTLGMNVVPFSGADGDGSGTIDSPDYTYWTSRYGALTSAVAVPEPGVISSVLLAAVSAFVYRRRSPRAC